MKSTNCVPVTMAALLLALTGCGGSTETSVGAASPEESKSSWSLFTRKATMIPAATPIRVRTTTTLSTASAQSGDTFRATLAEPLIVDGKQLAPKDADVEGVIVSADKGGRVKGVATISVRLTEIDFSGGPVGITTGVYTKQARTTKGKDAASVGIASGVGAAIGAIAGGGKGAAIGAGAGAGAGTGVVLATRGEPAVIAAETLLTFRLSSPVEVK